VIWPEEVVKTKNLASGYVGWRDDFNGTVSDLKVRGTKKVQEKMDFGRFCVKAREVCASWESGKV
jgi:hypothetical protein